MDGDHVAIGLSLHSGWAVAVGVAAGAAGPAVVLRRQLELVGDGLPGQLYHAAAGEPPEEATRLVRRVARAARTGATRALRHVVDELAAAGHRPVAVALCAEPHEVPSSVAAIVANHALMHAAEGELYRDVLEQAAERTGLPVLQVRAKRVAAEVADRLGLPPDRQLAVATALGAGLGPPWRADHKQAALLALVALAEHGGDAPLPESLLGASGAVSRGR